VVPVGVTCIEPDAATLPTPSIVAVVAPVIDHVKVTGVPGATLLGDALKVITGCAHAEVPEHPGFGTSCAPVTPPQPVI
jgi:hypothetical protein